MSDQWRVVEKRDTWNIEQGLRCIARLQKKVGSLEEAESIVDRHNYPSFLGLVDRMSKRIEELEKERDAARCAIRALLSGAASEDGTGDNWIPPIQNAINAAMAEEEGE